MAIAKEIIAAEQTRRAFRVELETEGALVILNYLIRVFSNWLSVPVRVLQYGHPFNIESIIEIWLIVISD